MQSPHPRRMLNDAIREKSLSQLIAAMEMIKADPRFLCSLQEFLPSILGRCVRHGSIDLVRYLLECEKAPVESLSPLAVAANTSIPLLELLVDHGWDLNKAEAHRFLKRGDKLIDLVCDDHQLVCWLVEHGARVTDGEVDLYEIFPQPAPLLETCAIRGSIATFRFLQSKGALLGHRTLHRAAGEAASFGANPFTYREVHDEMTEKESRTRKDRTEMLVFLVEELKLDINAMDSAVPYRAYHWGTPLCYAAAKEKGTHVIRWLLEKGAQPTVEAAQNVADAEMLAKLTGCTENERILREWKQMH
ncbi:uncharacterized protein FSUBG_1538 [Fusarium subglutinans]|uniref:Ankyrin n=1 Tax=Gibberella subglutinans TaxID=42677 RepID=A0A8H5QB07_GIBSU|nr:uncharacterized protein FSUBG_1538 [Fusarium subglutinans]KAF5612461.1 hypothetical protein FSUBG_1538 [Fusarium subglutinans]